VQEDIVKLLGLYRPKRVVTDFDRENLIFISKKVSREAAGNYIRAYCPHAEESGIIYTRIRRRTDGGGADRSRLFSGGLPAGMPVQDRAAARRAFRNDEAKVIMATNAFGIGIDKSNVRYVINLELPLSLEELLSGSRESGTQWETLRLYLPVE
jgi:ATP-dependent DNA helicase RecQ